MNKPMKLFDEWNEEKGWVEFVNEVGYRPAAHMLRTTPLQEASSASFHSSSSRPIN